MTGWQIFFLILFLLAAGAGTGGYFWWRYEYSPKTQARRREEWWTDLRKRLERELIEHSNDEIPEFQGKFRDGLMILLENVPPWPTKKAPKIPKAGEA